MFQAWQTVQVINQQSQYCDMAGLVIRTESKTVDGATVQLVTVKLDLVDEPQQFAASELKLLGA